MPAFSAVHSGVISGEPMQKTFALRAYRQVGSSELKIKKENMAIGELYIYILPRL